LLIATPTETGIQNSFKITEEEITAVKIRHAEISEKKRLEKSFTTHPLKESLELTKVVKGFSNLKNTCFIAAPLIGFIQFYLPYLSPLFQVNEGEELTEATNFDQRITQYVLSIGDLLRQEKFSRMNEIYKEFIELCIDGAKKGWFGGFENFQKQLASKSKKKGEDAASVNRKPPPETPNPTRTGYLQNVFSNFRSVRNEPSTINENTTMMEQEINQLPHKPESITDNKNNSQTNRKPVDFTPKDLAEQDSVEFLCSILQIISRTTYSPELSYYEMFEKTVISDGHELTIVKFNTTGTAPEQTMIYKLPISSEISLKDGFSLQMLLDDVMISKPPVEEQDTSVEPEDFKYTREGQYIGSVPLKKDTKEEGKSTWQITEERTILVAPKAPELIIIQLTLPGNLHERAAIAERLLKDSSQMVSITFRNEDTREDEIQKYEKVCTVFHAEHSPETKMARHFRASIKHPYWDWLLFDDLNAYSIPEDTDVNVDCGAPSMYILRKVTDSR
nr:hypothetical protein [Endozoicomonas sp.]